ncbi:MAG: hypothetical protein LBV60_16115 [Streptomyces sp.]|nr:hypothetical protein [Streptomyces sp.]
MTDGEYELTVPFVLVKSNGGPYDDEAFDAGMACGHLWAELWQLSTHEALPRPRYVHPDHVRQFDLIAMHYGYTIKPGALDEASGYQRIDFGTDYDDEPQP